MESTMTRMKVSVALATYNGEKYLSEQLESLARQITLPDELVVADDGSGDHTCEIIEDFRMHAPFPVHVISGQHLGYVSNFFRAIAACRGEVIALCDQDDIWRPEKLSVCLPYFRQNVTLVMHSARVVDAWGNPLAKRAPIVAKTRELTRGIFQDGPLKSFPLGFSLLIMFFSI
jgi:glycosyltransferase involved in cell wall biosynthesis